MTNLLVHGMDTAWTSSDSARLQISEVVQLILTSLSPEELDSNSSPEIFRYLDIATAKAVRPFLTARTLALNGLSFCLLTPDS